MIISLGAILLLFNLRSSIVHGYRTIAASSGKMGTAFFFAELMSIRRTVVNSLGDIKGEVTFS